MYIIRNVEYAHNNHIQRDVFAAFSSFVSGA